MRNKRGFTLVELLVVVSIVAVLVAISVPVLSASIEGARRGVCQANRASAQDVINSQVLLDGRLTQAQAQAAAQGSVGELAKLCPDKGRVDLVEKNDRSWSVRCNIHDTALDTMNSSIVSLLDGSSENGKIIVKGGKTLAKYLIDYFTSPADRHNGQSYLDSTGPNHGAPIKTALDTALGITGDYDFAISSYKSGNQYEYRVLITQPVTGLKTGTDTVSVTGYLFKKTSAGTMELLGTGSTQSDIDIDSKTLEGKTFNIIDAAQYDWSTLSDSGRPVSGTLTWP